MEVEGTRTPRLAKVAYALVKCRSDTSAVPSANDGPRELRDLLAISVSPKRAAVFKTFVIPVYSIASTAGMFKELAIALALVMGKPVWKCSSSFGVV